METPLTKFNIKNIGNSRQILNTNIHMVTSGAAEYVRCIPLQHGDPLVHELLEHCGVLVVADAAVLVGVQGQKQLFHLLVAPRHLAHTKHTIV